ncbi:NADPH:quinone oxidoreductase family protein [Aquincola tertiaricarbonis]|uniref:NADPH:quinone oxidoreductase family protein n=1 Tax=Aquincola tertiaricarbonis TaxID=391953 RepID=A0ABY4SC33_AQUTE|nr:NADPH:quinone oxidoreductase family protein [Aquincola tertiaricarbonis]URI08870.1 NADPH:quinone oxidoreductase family protein [Aquincola tertiaricarbonis]
MQAWVCDNPIGVDALQWKQLDMPQPAPGEVRIAIQAASLNFPDLLIVQNKYQVKPPLPFVPGAEFSGRIDAVGEGVTHLHIGDPVAAIGATGGFATHACVKATSVIPLPANFNLDDAAAFAFTYGTSHHALIDRAALQPGETVLVLGAAGGVGTSAIQIAKAAGARVIAAASSDEKCQLCTEIGADATINYSTTDLREALKTLTDGKGPDVVYDPVGGEFATAAFRSIAWRGRYLVIGFTAGAIPALPWNLPLLKGASVVGVFWGDFVRREPRASAAAMAQLADWYAQGKIKPVIDTRLPMSELHAAYERMGTRQVRGKVLLLNR